MCGPIATRSSASRRLPAVWRPPPCSAEADPSPPSSGTNNAIAKHFVISDTVQSSFFFFLQQLIETPGGGDKREMTGSSKAVGRLINNTHSREVTQGKGGSEGEGGAVQTTHFVPSAPPSFLCFVFVLVPTTGQAKSDTPSTRARRREGGGGRGRSEVVQAETSTVLCFEFRFGVVT